MAIQDLNNLSRNCDFVFRFPRPTGISSISTSSKLRNQLTGSTSCRTIFTVPGTPRTSSSDLMSAHTQTLPRSTGHWTSYGGTTSIQNTSFWVSASTAVLSHSPTPVARPQAVSSAPAATPGLARPLLARSLTLRSEKSSTMVPTLSWTAMRQSKWSPGAEING